MAMYRVVSLSFWSDSKVVDDFTPEDKFFYLYLFTNPHTNLCGCYELSLTQASNEMGYNKDVVERLIDRFINVHKVIDYSKENKEILLINWHKHNWTSSSKYMLALSKQIEQVKTTHFRDFLIDLFNAEDRVSIGYAYPMHTTNTITNTITNTNTISNKKVIKNIKYYPEDEILNKTFIDYIDMRKKIKAPMTDRAIELAITKLNKLSAGDNDKAIKILEQSIMNSWKGLFELKEQKKNSKAEELDEFYNMAGEWARKGEGE